MEDRRLNDLSTWVTTHLENITQITPLTGDASFRRYVRITTQDNSFIVMDAPPTKESCRAFVGIAKDFRGIGVNTPDVIAQDIERGFLLLTDFGDDLLNTALTDDNANQFYQRCFDPLILIQQQQQLKHYPLVPYNNVIYTYYEESSWFLTWYLQQYRQLSLSPKDLATVEREIHFICAAMSRQPQTVIHRDYHSRNIMLTKEGDLGILDFQDAVIGPIAYDLVSLLRDCYINWPEERVCSWVRDYHARLVDAKITDMSYDQFQQWFDLAGLQRHLKCAGLFVRLNLRDNKSEYLKFIPRVLNYITHECGEFKELNLISDLITSQCEA